MKEVKIDRYGLCPNCKSDWNGRDVYEDLNRLSVFSHKSPQEMTTLASNYGWSDFSKTKFSKVIIIELEDGRILYKCPEIRCGHIFDVETGFEYEDIVSAKEGEGESINKITEEIQGVTIEDFEEAREAFEKDRSKVIELGDILTGNKGDLEVDDGGLFGDIHNSDDLKKLKDKNNGEL